MARDVVAFMESARDLAKGTMEMCVLFATDEEVAEATAWMVGKQKVKTLTPMTHAESARRHAGAHKQIAKKFGAPADVSKKT